MTLARIAIGDIETAPIKSNTWGLWDQNVGLNQIDKEWAILSFSWKPLGGTKSSIIYMDTSDKSDPYDDKDLCLALGKLLDEYDFLIAQNGKRFDLRKIRARMIMHGLPPHSPIRVIDTMLMARQVAAFTSNKLEWLTDKLTNSKKSAHKEFPGFELWTECLKGNPKAWAAMKKYNIRDIVGTEEVYLKLRPWTNDHPNFNVYNEGDAMACHRCGSEDIKRHGYSYTNAGKYARYRCNSCFGWSQSRYTENSNAKRKSLLK